MNAVTPFWQNVEVVFVWGAIPLLLVFGLWGGRWMERTSGKLLGIRYRIFVIALSFYLPIQAYRWWSAGEAGMAQFPEFLRQGMGAVSVFFGALLLVRVVQRGFWDGWYVRTQAARAPRFVSDIGAALIVGVGVVVIAKVIYRVDLSGFRLGSTVSVAVLGFASQDLLGNLLSGIALQIASPFRQGDWLLLDGKRLQVVEVNWRATRMRSPDNVMVEVPNKTVAGGMITNLSAPTKERALSFVVGFEYGADPEGVKACLLRAATAAEGVLAHPAPRVVLKEFGESAISYEVFFWVGSEEAVPGVSDAVKTRVWHEARRDGLEMPFPTRRVLVDSGPDAASRGKRAEGAKLGGSGLDL